MSVNVAIVGATGAVGVLLRKVLEERRFPVNHIKFLASEKSVGQSLTFRGQKHHVEAIRPEAFSGIDIVLSSTPSSVSREFSPIAAKAGAIVVDNSSAWRMDPEVPLVVPEVNAEQLKQIPKRIVANPNCVAIPLTVVLAPLHRHAQLLRVVVSTYQSSSGKGAKGLADYDAQIAAIGRGEPLPMPKAHAAPLAGNVLPHDWTIGPDGFTEEETKVINETKKILGSDVPVVPTCVRVPVRVSHSLAITAEFARPISLVDAKRILGAAPGVIFCEGEPPLPLNVEGYDEVFVGRLRQDPTVPHGLVMWAVADNLRKGAATNAVQIAERLVLKS
jgi:aspartate-semialdehyde dehydrogenase